MSPIRPEAAPSRTTPRTPSTSAVCTTCAPSSRRAVEPGRPRPPRWTSSTCPERRPRFRSRRPRRATTTTTLLHHIERRGEPGAGVPGVHRQRPVPRQRRADRHRSACLGHRRRDACLREHLHSRHAQHHRSVPGRGELHRFRCFRDLSDYVNKATPVVSMPGTPYSATYGGTLTTSPITVAKTLGGAFPTGT